jgi:predicted transcriptional regulator
MRKITEVLRLKFEARLSHERIAAATGLSKGAVSNYVQRAVQKSLGWPLPQELDEAALERLLFPQVVQREQYTHADYAHVHQELKRKGVTLQLLWEEYHAAHGERAYRYSQFCWHYQRFQGSLARSMRQTHRAGEKLFIDYSGDTVPVISVVTGRSCGRRSSSPRWGRANTPMRKPPGRSSCRTGSPRTCGCSSTWAVFQRS